MYKKAVNDSQICYIRFHGIFQEEWDEMQRCGVK